MRFSVSSDWWKHMFDEVYLRTDARSVCDEEITRREVDLVCELLPIRPEDRILDLCGGHGRHSLELCSRGHTGCTLIDYSLHLVNHARTCASQRNYPMACIQADARRTSLPSESFDHILIMGNSLGYIPEPAADRQILNEARRVLRSGGWLLIDVTDGEAVKDSFSPTAWHEIAPDMVVCRRRAVEGNTMYAREMVLDKEKGLIRDCTYAIRLYEPQTFGSLLEEAGFVKVTVHTDFSPHLRRGDYGFMNRRMVATGQKP